MEAKTDIDETDLLKELGDLFHPVLIRLHKIQIKHDREIKNLKDQNSWLRFALVTSIFWSLVISFSIIFVYQTWMVRENNMMLNSIDSLQRTVERDRLNCIKENSNERSHTQAPDHRHRPDGHVGRTSAGDQRGTAE